MNLYDYIVPPKDERFDELFGCENVRIERIVTVSVDAPKEFVQDHDEWVVVIEGEALLEIAGVKRWLKNGDILFIPKGEKHTLLDVKEPTLWLAVPFRC